MTTSNFILDSCKQPTSKKIVEKLLQIPEKEINGEALIIILFATEEGLACRETAEDMVSAIAESTELDRDIFLIIKDLVNNSYFHPTPEISALIESYLKRVGNKFDTETDREIYGELIVDSFDTILAKGDNLHE